MRQYNFKNNGAPIILTTFTPRDSNIKYKAHNHSPWNDNSTDFCYILWHNKAAFGLECH